MTETELLPTNNSSESEAVSGQAPSKSVMLNIPVDSSRGTRSTKTTVLAEELQPILWPEVAAMRSYPQTIEEFVDQHAQHVLPSRSDKAAATLRGREDIWNFFFQITADDVRRIQDQERETLVTQRQDCVNLYNDRQIRLNARLTRMVEQSARLIEETPAAELAQQRITELDAIIRDKSLKFRPFLLGALGVALALTVLGSLSTLTNNVPFSVGRVISTFVTWAIFTLIIAGVAYLIANQFLANRERSERSALRVQLQQRQRYSEDEPRIRQALARFEQEYQQRLHLIDQRLKEMDQAIEPLLAQLPQAPQGELVIERLQHDLEDLKQHYIQELGLSKRLGKPARVVDGEDDEFDQIDIPNPLPFVSPGQLQELSRIPTPYQPPQNAWILEQLNSMGQHARNLEGRALVSQLWQTAQRLRGGVNSALPTGESSGASKSMVLSDRARHLLARRLALQNEHMRLLHGVYYIEFLFIAQDMLIHHGFFYDFILNKTTADRTTELFFRDIVALQKSLEYRFIPGRFETEEAIEIEDAPTLSITLPSGDERTFTFANPAYFAAVVGDIMNRPVLTNTADESSFDPIREAQLDADGALRFLSQMLRKHKYLSA